jgi:transcriptional regulator with XRE-family HTH domain
MGNTLTHGKAHEKGLKSQFGRRGASMTASIFDIDIYENPIQTRRDTCTISTSDQQEMCAVKEVTTQELQKQVGRNIQMHRSVLSLTQLQIAGQLGIEVETVSRYERGVMAPSFGQLQPLSDALRIPVSALFADATRTRDDLLIQACDKLSAEGRVFMLNFVRLYTRQHAWGG